MQEKIVNLTGNDITIVGNYQQIVATIPRSNKQATIRFEREVIRQINGRVPLVRIPDELISIEGVPDPEPGVLYVVSSIIAQNLRRPDVVSPDTAPGGVVKVNGRLIGVRGLQSWADEDTEPGRRWSRRGPHQPILYAERGPMS